MAIISHDLPDKYFYNDNLPTHEISAQINMGKALFAIANELYKLRMELQTEPRTIESALINLERTLDGIRHDTGDGR